MSNVDEIVQEMLVAVHDALAAAVADRSGMLVGSASAVFGIDFEVAVVSNVEILRVMVKTSKNMGINDQVDDILITSKKFYHIIRTAQHYGGMFYYMILDRVRGNLALAR